MKSVYYSGYLEGLLNIASSLSKNIGPSYIKVDCYEKKTFKENFCKKYKIEKKELNLIKSTESLETALLDWIQDQKIVESVLYWFNIKLRKEKTIYQSDEKLISILDEKQRDFYSLEDLFFVECDQFIFVFLLGNNE